MKPYTLPEPGDAFLIDDAVEASLDHRDGLWLYFEGYPRVHTADHLAAPNLWKHQGHTFQRR